LLYADVATGYKAGGFNDFDASTHGTAPYAPEQLTAYEIGYKKKTSVSQFTTDLFYYDYAKDQISSLTNVAGNMVIYTKPVPAKLYGLENTMKLKLTASDQVNGSLSFLHSAYGTFETGICDCLNFTGKSLDKTPAATATLGYSHTANFGQGQVKMYVGTKYSSSFLVSDFLDGIQYTQKAYTRSNANVTYIDEKGKFNAQLFVTNIENKLQMTGMGNTNTSYPSFGVSEPRFFGIRVGVNY
jgi:iron complex outermembrane receptor protein